MWQLKHPSSLGSFAFHSFFIYTAVSLIANAPHGLHFVSNMVLALLLVRNSCMILCQNEYILPCPNLCEVNINPTSHTHQSFGQRLFSHDQKRTKRRLYVVGQKRNCPNSIFVSTAIQQPQSAQTNSHVLVAFMRHCCCGGVGGEVHSPGQHWGSRHRLKEWLAPLFNPIIGRMCAKQLPECLCFHFSDTHLFSLIPSIL